MLKNVFGIEGSYYYYYYFFSGWGEINYYSVSFVFCTHKPPVLTHAHIQGTAVINVVVSSCLFAIRERKRERKKRSVFRLLPWPQRLPLLALSANGIASLAFVLNSPVHFACVWCRVQSSSVLAVHSFSPLYLCFKRVLRHGAYAGTQHGFFFIYSICI